MGGSIDVKSEKGKGTTFIIHLGFNILDENEYRYLQNSSKENIENIDLTGRKVLLVEDHPINAEIAKKVLEKKNMVVFKAEDGQIGLDKFISSNEGFFDIILMDIRMPKLNGIEATKAIRSLEREDAKTIPIIAMTANAYEKDIEECLNAGMNEHLSKPINPDYLYKIISKYITGEPNKVKQKILIVDDVMLNADILKVTLENDYDVILTRNGVEALNELSKYPDIIAVITDIQMPEMDGIELIKNIRANHQYDHLAILANTQYGDTNQAEYLLSIGADDFIYKPTSARITVSRLNNILSKYK